MKRRFISVPVVLLILFAYLSCANIPQTESDLNVYLDDLGEKYEAVCVEMGTQNWNLYSKEAEADQDGPKLKYAELLLDPKHMKVVDNGLARIDREENPRLYRRLFVWKNVLTAARVDMDENVFRMENQLEQEVNEYTHDVDGKPVLHNELRQVLSNKIKDALELEARYEAYSDEMQKAFEPRVLELMKLRNEKARGSGFKDYGEMCLFMTELLADESKWFYDVIDFIEEKTLEPFKELVEKGSMKTGKEVSLENIREIVYSMTEDLPAHVGYPTEKALDLAKKTAANIGFDIDALPIRLVEKALPYGGLNLAIHIPSDIRILVRPNSGRVGLFLHEFGHGLEAVFNQTPEPIFKNYEWCLGASTPSYEEGMANVMERFADHDKWQVMFNKKSKARAEKEKDNQNLLSPYTIRSTIVEFLFEFELYRNLDRDPEDVAKDLYKKWLFIDGESHPQKYWATSIFPVAYPCYRQSYFIADILAWQVHEFLKDKFGDDYLFNSQVGEWLIEHLFKKGHDLPWMDRIEGSIGQKLDIAGYLASFGID